MPIDPKDVKWLGEPKLGLLEQLYFPAIVEGLQTTVKHLFQPKITVQYPEEKAKLPANYRGVHRLNRDEQGRVKCVACYMCSTACPAHCIDIVAAPSPWPDREKYPEMFVIDELRCIYCGMCEEACPVDAIELTHIYDLTGETRESLNLNKEKLLAIYDETKDNPKDPVRTARGRLGPASEFAGLPTLGPATAVADADRSAGAASPGVIKPLPPQK